MTEKQRFKLYFPLWQKACGANGWTSSKHQTSSFSEAPSPKSEWVMKVETFAKQKAESRKLKGEDGRVTVDDYRHGAHIVALGRDKSSKDLSNAELDRVVSLFRLLIDETDLDASMDMANPERGQAARIKWFIEHAAPFAYVDAICKGKFGGKYVSPFWEDLPMWALKDLARTLAERKRGWTKSVERRERESVKEHPALAEEPVLAEEPF